MQLHRQTARLTAAGAQLVVIGSGEPRYVSGFRKQTGYDGPVYCDPELGAYRAAGLKRGVWRTLQPAVVFDAAKTLAGGEVMQGLTRGDTFQQGGVLVTLPADRVVYQHVSERAGDNAPAEEVVAALERALSGRAAP